MAYLHRSLVLRMKYGKTIFSKRRVVLAPIFPQVLINFPLGEKLLLQFNSQPVLYINPESIKSFFIMGETKDAKQAQLNAFFSECQNLR